MRIPLDYYRILGLPLAANQEQLQQAYRDRTVQLPRREYSDAAITARKQLIEEAYSILSDPEKRSSYDERYLSQTYDSDSITPATTITQKHYKSEAAAIDPQTPSIEITKEQFVGALLILQELGEYELVLKLGRPYLSSRTPTKPAQGATSSNSGTLSEPSIEYSDIVLTVALACLELGREQWQQGQYENAAMSLETGQELLLREGLFPGVRGEIQSDLYKLRPYRILELLALPQENVAERRQGINLLQNILQERGGIDGSGDDQSGLSIDDFLRFIQQLRGYLTAEEQHKLFEAESKRPSPVATYLAVYALLARGFAGRKPALIRQAKQMLIALGKRQDVHLEQSVCALLLGQTEEASSALELSQEYEPLAFIRENSQGSPDLLPGLCLYGERWLQNEVFPHFRDLAQERASLKDYFADEQVQAYLEALPTDAQQSNQWEMMTPGSVSYARTDNSVHTRSESVTSAPTANNYSGMNGRRQTSTTASAYNYTTPEPPTAANSPTSAANLHSAEHMTTEPPPTTAEVPKATAGRKEKRSQRSKRRSRSQHTHNPGRNGDGTGQKNSVGRFANSLDPSTRMVWVVFGSLVGVMILVLLGIAAINLLREIFSPASALKGEQLMIQLEQPPLPIPGVNNQLIAATGPLTDATAEQVVQTWLTAKAAALGSNHNIGSLDQILTGEALTQWRQVAEQDQQENRYRQFRHTVKVESVRQNETDADQAEVEATVNEIAEFYENGELNQQKSYDENLRVRYILVRQDGFWRIREMVRL